MKNLYFADVIIVGAGAAGIMAGLEICKAGYSCYIIEKGKNIAASNAAVAGGPSLANTKTQAKQGESVSEEMLYQHMSEFSRGTVNQGLLRNAIGAGKIVEEHFLANGVHLTLREDVYGVGFRARHLFQTVGEKRFQPLAEAIESSGGKIHFNREGIRLIKKNACVTGVLVKDCISNEECRYFGKAVIVATGGYLGNEEMRKKHFGDISIVALGSTASDGKGIEMVVEAGGMEDRNWGICANEFGGANHKLKEEKRLFSTNLRYAICGGLLVDRMGNRFMNEQYLSDEPLSIGGEMTLRAGRFYAVLDDDMFQQLHRNSTYEFYGSPEQWRTGKMTQNGVMHFKEEDLKMDIASGIACCEDTIEKAGNVFGLTGLEATVDRYNRACQIKKDTQFGKSAYLLKPIKKAPFYIFEYEPSAWCTFGGVKTDEFCRALDTGQNVIPGLYVAGVDNGSCYTVPYYDNEGAALGLAFELGIVAARHIIMEDE